MSPAGSSDDQEPRSQLTLRPVVSKTLIKGALAIGVLSLFLNIASNLVNYFIFLALSFGAVGIFMLFKHQSTYLLGDDAIMIKRRIGKSNTISYRDILDMSISQGMLARRFKCGSVYMVLKHGIGGQKMLGGGTAERLYDIPNPNYIYDLISSKLGPFSDHTP